MKHAVLYTSPPLKLLLLRSFPSRLCVSDMKESNSKFKTPKSNLKKRLQKLRVLNLTKTSTKKLFVIKIIYTYVMSGV